MKQEQTDLGEMLLVGITARTNNKAEMNPETAKIGQTFEKYLGKQLPANIKHRLTPGVTYSVYADFESDEHGEYTYFLGKAA